MNDIRDEIFRDISSSIITACVLADDDGVVSGIEEACSTATRLGLHILTSVEEGSTVSSKDVILKFTCSPKQAADAEDVLIGILSKPSGIATAARRFVNAAGGVRIVSGAWKKQPGQIKSTIQRAVRTGGAFPRISDEPMIYLDKNYTKMLGGIGASLRAVQNIPNRIRVIQIKGRWCGGDIGCEAVEAVENGADILYVDTGDIADVQNVKTALKSCSRSYKLAFGGGVRFQDIPTLLPTGIDILGVGRQIIDAPLLDMKFEVI